MEVNLGLYVKSPTKKSKKIAKMKKARGDHIYHKEFNQNPARRYRHLL